MTPLHAAAAAPPNDINGYAHQVMTSFGSPGMAITIVEGEKTWIGTYGVRQLGRPDRIDVDTIFPIGSNSKAFTAASLAILVDDGKLGWDDLVIDHLSDFRMYDPWVTREMTVRDLLVHRSGLGLGAGDLLYTPETDLTRDEIVHRLRYIKPKTSFRSGFAYDNILYIVAGQVVAKAAGTSWDEFVRDRIFAPLSMTNAQTSAPRPASANQVAGHARSEGDVRGLGSQQVLTNTPALANVAAAGGIHASASDMAHWLHALIHAGQSKSGSRLYSERQAREIWTPQSIVPIGNPPAPLALTKPNFRAYGFGWTIQDYRGHRIITHTGGVLGGLSVVTIVPEKNVGFSVLLNSEEDGALRAIMYNLLDHYLDLPGSDWLAAAKQVQTASLAAAKDILQQAGGGSPPTGQFKRGPSLPFARYTGVYKDAWYGTATVRAIGSGLEIEFDRTPGMIGPLTHWHHDTFRTRWKNRSIEDAFVTFGLDASGSIDRVTMRPVSPLADFSFNFEDLLFVPSLSEEDAH